MKQAAAVIISNKKGKILILKRSSEVDSFKKFWNFPAGGMEEGESAADCAIRECKEETGLVIDKDSLVYVGGFEVGENTSIDKVHYFFTRKYEGEIKLDFENSSYLWVNGNEIDKFKFIPIPHAVKTAILFF
tara:strand:+ start:99 stop:494 length:396 start_codon:yes stop_codon:yes gene_type:complete